MAVAYLQWLASTAGGRSRERRIPGYRSSRGRRNPKETQWTGGQAKERGEYVTFDLQTD